MDEKKQLVDIENRIKEVRTLLSELENAAKDLREQDQHNKVDHLDDYLNETDKEMQAISLFKEEVVKEIKELVQWLKNRIN